MECKEIDIDAAADRLGALYGEAFAGKRNGRYRISAKLVRRLMRRRRLYEDEIRGLSRALYERGYLLLDLDSYFVVLSTGIFGNYRRVNEELVE